MPNFGPRWLAAIAIAVTACAGGAETPPGPTTTLDPFGANFVRALVAEADDAGLDDDEARCIATSIYADIGDVRLVELGIAEDGTGGGLLDGGRGFTAAERRQVTAGFERCLEDPLAWLLPVRTDEDQCILDYIRSSEVTLEQLLFAEEPGNEEAVGLALVDAAGACLGD